MNLISGVEFVVHETSDDASFTDRLIAQENELVFGERGHRRHFSLFLLSHSQRRNADLNLTNSQTHETRKKREEMKDDPI